MQWHKIEEMARAGCTSPRAIRHWEDLGLLGEVKRTNGSTRRYTPDQLNTARIIAAAQYGGWSLDEIKAMLAEWGHETYEAICTRLSDQMRAAIRLIEELPIPAGAAQEYDL